MKKIALFGAFVAVNSFALQIRCDEEKPKATEIKPEADCETTYEVPKLFLDLFDDFAPFFSQMHERFNRNVEKMEKWRQRAQAQFQSFPINYKIEADEPDRVTIIVELPEAPEGKIKQSGTETFSEADIEVPLKEGFIKLHLQNIGTNSEMPYALLQMHAKNKTKNEEIQRKQCNSLPALNLEKIEIKRIPETSKIQISVGKAASAQRYSKEIEL
ncbi:MAG TPA: hypothetical protein VHO47_00530 [Candidatus Babeliales bacterium]|nr:hypothetical protein [Candidatus Babeliales bacterium]